MIRLDRKSSTVIDEVTSIQQFEVGASVEFRLVGDNEEWVKGKITAENSNGTYNIKYGGLAKFDSASDKERIDIKHKFKLAKLTKLGFGTGKELTMMLKVYQIYLDLFVIFKFALNMYTHSILN